MKGKVYFLSLGCPRNLIDSEYAISILSKNGWFITDNIEEADLAIVNTCGFIKEAKEEAIEFILELADYRKRGKIKRLIVGGCLTQRYKDDFLREIKEIDAVLGINWKELPRLLEPGVNYIYPLYRDIMLTPPHYSYLRIADGCDNRCSYCAISNIRGPLHSRKIDDIVAEATFLIEHGVKELNIVAQDTTSYGKDIYGKTRLAELLERINEICGDFWIRLLYAHPAHLSDEIIEAFTRLPKLCKYIDLPLQHVNDKILKLMGRKIRKKDIIKLILKLRQALPGIAIRTTFIVGFPQETDEIFLELIDFIKEIRFEKLGAFIYSREENTPAYNLEGQISEKVKKERYHYLMQVQQEIVRELNRKKLHNIERLLIDESDEEYFYARTQYDAPEVDGIVYLKKNKKLNVGDFVFARIIDTWEYDLKAQPC